MSRLHDWKYSTLPTNICRQWVKAFNTFTYWTMCFQFWSAHSIMKVWCIERQSFIVIFCKFLIQMVTLMNKQWLGKDITSLESHVKRPAKQVLGRRRALFLICFGLYSLCDHLSNAIYLVPSILHISTFVCRRVDTGVPKLQPTFSRFCS